MTRQTPKAKKGNIERHTSKVFNVLHETTWNQQNILNDSGSYKQPESSIITENRENRNQSREEAGGGTSNVYNHFFNLDETVFEELDEPSHLSNLNKKHSSKLEDTSKELVQGQPQEEKMSGNVAEWNDKEVELEEMEDLEGFTDYVDWDKDYVPLTENERADDNEYHTVEYQRDKHPGIAMSTASGSRKRQYDKTEGAFLFVHNSSQSPNEGTSQQHLDLMKLATKRSRLEENDPISNAPDRAAQFAQTIETSGGGSKEIETSNIEATSPGKESLELEVPEVDLEWLLREYGSCVEFV